MGGMGSAFNSFASDKGVQGGMMGLSNGLKTGSSIANAEYNAAAMRQQAESLQQQSSIQAYMIRNNYRKQYQELLDQQTRQQSMNRVLAMKNGITGASAAAVLGSYAAKGQKNLDQLYYNAAMQTAQNSLQTASRVHALEEKARQYDWQATANLIGGVVSLGTGMMDLNDRWNNKANTDPTSVLNKQAEQTMISLESDQASMWR